MKIDKIYIFISILIGISEMILLINLFPQTGLSRIVFIPFLITMNLILTLGLNIILKSYSLKIKTISFALIQIGFFHFCLWLWPQSAAIQKNLITEFYGILL